MKIVLICLICAACFIGAPGYTCAYADDQISPKFSDVDAPPPSGTSPDSPSPQSVSSDSTPPEGISPDATPPSGVSPDADTLSKVDSQSANPVSK